MRASRSVLVQPPGLTMLPLLGLYFALPLCAGLLEEARSWGDTSDQVSGVLGGPGRAPGAGCSLLPPPPSGAWLRDRLLDAREGGITPMSWHIVPPSLLRPQCSAWELPHLLFPRGESLADKVSCRIVSALQSPAEPNLFRLLLPARVSAGFVHF